MGKFSRKNKQCIFFLLALYITVINSYSQESNESNMVMITPGTPFDTIIKKAAHVKPTPRQVTWQELEFTSFVHFGLNTFYDREWGEKNYEALRFNPSALNAGQWVRTAKMAGAKLLIIVAKHHDGFCLWPSKHTSFSLKNSPWKNGAGDVVGEVAEACRKQGIKFGVYLSPWDIHSPVYGTEEYNQYFKNQLRELLTNYGEISEVWFDGACGEGPNGRKQVYDWDGYFTLIRELAPNAVIAVMGPDVRWVGTETGYGRETEWSVVPASAAMMDDIAYGSQQSETDGIFIPSDDLYKPDIGSRDKIRDAKGLIWYPSEVDVSLRPGWFYHKKEDSLVKSPKKLVDIYNASVGLNSVLLLNFSPDKRGLINRNDIQNVRGMRKILDKTFKNNLAKNASLRVDVVNIAYNAEHITDNDPLTYWTPGIEKTTATIEISLSKSKTFNRCVLQENFRNGQRVESFVLDVFQNGKWEKLTGGTTIGYKRILVFDDTNTQKVRLRILSSRDYPEISTFGLYKAP